MNKRLRTVAYMVICIAAIPLSHAQAPTVPDRVAALKSQMAASQAALKKYEWIETTVVSLKGEEKSRKQMRCYYAADGSLQKVAVEATPKPEEKRGVRGKVVENKKEEMADYMKSAVALIKTYVPPSPAKLQAAKDAGKVTIAVLEAGKRDRLDFKDYEKPGDTLGIEVDLTKNVPTGVNVATYLDTATDAVTLTVRMSQLPDGAVYTSDIALNAKAKEIQVNVQNSGYKKTGN
jgi:hypothetical protein